MSLKEKIKLMLNIYTRVVSGILLLNCIYLFWVSGSEGLRIIDILGIQMIGLVCSVGYLPFMVEKQYSKMALGILNTIFFLFVNATVLLTGYFLNWFSFEYKRTVIGMEVMIIVIYTATKVSFYLIDYKDALKLNKKIQERNRDNNLS